MRGRDFKGAPSLPVPALPWLTATGALTGRAVAERTSIRPNCPPKLPALRP